MEVMLGEDCNMDSPPTICQYYHIFYFFFPSLVPFPCCQVRWERQRGKKGYKKAEEGGTTPLWKFSEKVAH